MGRLAPFNNSPCYTSVAGMQRCLGCVIPRTFIHSTLKFPPTSSNITVDFDTLLENTVSDHQLLLAWNTVVLYPRNIDKGQLIIEPSILLPPGWKQGSALRVTSQAGNRVNYEPVSLERLIDSPVLAGEFYRAVPLASTWPAELNITGDSQAAVDKADDAHAFALFGKLVDQDRAMFGFRHWQTLHLLVSQSAAVPFDGLEHEDSPYNAVGDAALSKKMNWRSSVGRFSLTSSRTPGTASIGVRQSFIRSPTTRALNGRRCSGCMRA